MAKFDDLTDDQLAFLVAEARGCRPAQFDAWHANPILMCPCPGMPHGTVPATGPGRLHRFPRDIAVGFLKSKDITQIEQSEEGVTACKFVITKRGEISMKITQGCGFDGYSFAVLMRGAAKEMDDYYEGEARRHSKTQNKFERDVDDLMGGADGV